MPGTLITSEVNFEAPGRQTGFLRLPHSVHRSAYGWLPVPVTVLTNGKGPTLLMLAGVHGDEYEGQIALTKLVHSLTPDQIRGRIIILTMVNFPAAEAGLRTSPIDEGNLNRAFPGDPGGTPTHMIAHYVESVLMPMADHMVDLHSGGTSLCYPPTLLRGPGHDETEAARLKTLQAAFDLPYTWVFTGGGGPKSTARTALGAANRKGVTGIMAELGGGGAVSRDVLRRTERGLRRVLHALDMLPSYTPDAAQGTRELNARGSVFTSEAGLFEPFKDIADPVAEGETVGMVHHPDTPWQAPDPVRSEYQGMVLCKRSLGQVRRGDAVFQIAADVEAT
ncbi:MAG: succinylglutamate desuccinylase [Rhodobacteraceae bacterium]|nr:succinylglutamate desuccinylase [Paracoccaceae bacterium]